MFTIITIIIFIVLIYFFGDKIQKSLQKSSKNITPNKIIKIDKINNSTKAREQFITQNNYVVILCYANWCSHCPLVKEWFSDLVDKSPLPNFKFIAIEEKDLPKELLNKIPGFPTILIQKDKSIDIYNGARSKNSLLSYLENL